MTTSATKQKSEYVVVPRHILEQNASKKSMEVLRALRTAVSRAWHGGGAVDEIRSQRTKV